MAKVLWGGVQQLFDNLGDVLNGGIGPCIPVERNV